LPALEFYIATINVFLCYIFSSVQTVLPYEGHTDLLRNTLRSHLENSDLAGRQALRRERIRNTRGRNSKTPTPVKLSEVIKKEKASTWL